MLAADDKIPTVSNPIEELNRRLIEDDADPNDTISWDTIKSEAIARWQRWATSPMQTR